MSHEEGGGVCLLLDALSNELLLHVLGFLELAPDLNRVSMACRTLNELAHAPTLWRCVRFPRLACLITPPQHRASLFIFRFSLSFSHDFVPTGEGIASLQAAGGAGDEDDASVLRSKDQQSRRDSKQDVQVFPDLLLQHVVARHNKDVREIDLSLVPFNQATCRMKEHQVYQLLRDVFVRCTRLERFLCPQLFRAKKQYLSEDDTELFTTWPKLGHEAPRLRVLDLSGWRIPNMLDFVDSFPNVETLALACAKIESASELLSLTNLKHLDISYVAKHESDESLATQLNLKTLISIQETGLYGNRRTHPPQHRDAMGEDSCRIIQTDIFAQGGLDDQSLVSSVTNPACFDFTGRTLLHRAADDPKRIMQLRQLVDESGHVDAPLAAGLDRTAGITHVSIRYNRFIHGAKRSVSDRLGGLSFPSPITAERRDKLQTRPMLLTPQPEAPGSTALHIACANGNQEAPVAYLLAKGADANSVNDIGQTPLMLACHSGNLLAVSALIATGRVAIGLQDNQGRTALHYAALGCPCTDSVSAPQALPQLAEQLFELLLGAGANVNQPNNNGFSALHLACMARNSALVVYLLSRGASVSVGISPLFCLSGDGELSVFGNQSGDVGALIDVLVTAGCPVNAVNETGKTLLRVACQDRDADLAEALLRHADVDVNLADAVGWTPLHAVSCQVLSARAAAETAPRAGSGSLFPGQGRASASSSMYAMDYRYTSTELGTSSSGSTSAMFHPPRAAPPPSPPRHDLASLLLSRQANVNATTIDGQSPLLVAAITSVKEVDGRQSMHPMQARYTIVQEDGGEVVPFLRKLIESGADVNAQDARGWTALHAVCASGHLEAVGFLLSHGANVNARDFKSVTPLIAAARGVLQHGAANSVPVLRAPLPVGRSGSSQRREQPPAPEAGSLTICKLLLSHGAQFDVVDEVDGETALHLLTRAATGPHNGVLDWAVVQLKDHGIFHLRNAKGETLLHTAIACNNAQLVSTLLQHGADKSLRSYLGETALHTALRLQSATRTARLSTQLSESCNSVFWPSSTPILLHQVHGRADFNSWGYPMWHVKEARNSAKSGLPPDPLSNDRAMPRNVAPFGRTNTPTSKQIIVALVARGLTEEECTAKDCFGLTVLHWAAALGANAPRATQDKGLSLAVLSLYIVDHILTHFKDQVMDAVDERGDTALHKLAEMRQVTSLMTASQTSHVGIEAPQAPSAGSDADFDDVFLREAYGELTSAASQIEQRLLSWEGTTTTAEKPLRKRRNSPEAAAAVPELPSASKRKKRDLVHEDDEEEMEMEMEMEIESTLPAPAPTVASNCPTSKNAAAADGSPGMLALCGDAIALLFLQARANCAIQNRRGETPLHVACRRSVTPLIATLLSYAASDVNAVNRDGDTALHLLLGSSYAPEVLTRAAPTSEARALWDSALASLLAAGADVSKCNGIGQNALHTACRANLVVAVRQLLARPGVDVNAPELGTGLTPLMLALRNAQPEPTALVLLCHGADATRRDALGRSAEDLAGPQLWASLLRQAALAPDAIDDDQRGSSVEGVDQHRATGLLSSAPRPRPGAISLVAREAKGLRLLQQAKASRPVSLQKHAIPSSGYMGFTSAADH